MDPTHGFFSAFSTNDFRHSIDIFQPGFKEFDDVIPSSQRFKYLFSHFN